MLKLTSPLSLELTTQDREHNTRCVEDNFTHPLDLFSMKRNLVLILPLLVSMSAAL